MLKIASRMANVWEESTWEIHWQAGIVKATQLERKDTQELLLISSLDDCVASCVENEYCTHFTHHPTSNLCVMNNGCPELSTETCPDCQSGSVDECLVCFEEGKWYQTICMKKYSWVHFISGYCFGSNLGVAVASSADECLERCRANPSCQWFTFNSLNGACSLTADCQWLDLTCGQDCTHGMRSCPKSGEEGMIK